MGFIALFIGAVIPRAWLVAVVCLVLAGASIYVEKTLAIDVTPLSPVTITGDGPLFAARSAMMLSIALTAWFARRRITLMLQRSGFPAPEARRGGRRTRSLRRR